MKTVDKYKKKLKVWKWCKKHFGNTLAIFYGVTYPLSYLIAAFAPILGFSLHMISLCSALFGGIFFMAYADNTNHGLMLEKKVAAMENVTPRSVEVLENSIEYYKENPTQFKDKKSTKNLIRELIKIKKCAKIALEEKKQAEKEAEKQEDKEEDFTLDM
jgi:hypothetical protein